MTAPPGQPWKHRAGLCDCGKVRYADRRTAKRAARALHPNAALRPYRCGQYWHIGNTPTAVKQGLRGPVPGVTHTR